MYIYIYIYMVPVGLKMYINFSQWNLPHFKIAIYYS